MEEPPFEQTTARWSRPRCCHRCGYPMAQSLDACPSCERPAHALSRSALRRLGRKGLGILRSLLGFCQLCIVIIAGLTLAYYLSPLLLLFPLGAVLLKPSASRGGKTVVVGRRAP